MARERREREVCLPCTMLRDSTVVGSLQVNAKHSFIFMCVNRSLMSSQISIASQPDIHGKTCV